MKAKFQNALVSVSDKTNLENFLGPLVMQGLKIVSTGGTAQYLKEKGFKVKDISELTKFPEVMGGRVKTLHPMVHMALLSREGNIEDQNLLKEFSLEAFDLVVCNLYPFEKAVVANASDKELIEKIDVGGPTMLRAAAKNHNRVAVVCDPNDYQWILDKEEIELKDKRKLAAKVFMHTACYDSLVAQNIGDGIWSDEQSFSGRKVMDLRYGENPHQKAGWYSFHGNTNGLHSAKVLQGKPLSYNNILDLDAATLLVKEFDEPTVVAVKHNNPCGVASAKIIAEATKFAVAADPVSVFGGIIALNRKVDLETAESLSHIFLECIIAPDYSKEALAVFEKKKNLRILVWPSLTNSEEKTEIKGVDGGFLLQTTDRYFSQTNEWRFLTNKANLEKLEDLIFAEKIAASLKSNAIVLVKNKKTLGMGMGQVNRVEAVQHAIDRMHKHHGQQESVVMASDAFFPFADSIELAAQNGVEWVLQPGGSLKDEEVFKKAADLKVSMVITGTRHFRH